MSTLDALRRFASESKFRGKGALSVALVMTDKARAGLPLDVNTLLTAGGGQVEGLGKAQVQAILKRHGIARTLAEEGGRTSRGSVGNMRIYIEFLNGLPGGLDLDVVEEFWIERVKEFFAGKPFKFRADQSLSVRASIRELLAQANTRHKEMPGSRHESTMLQHLVGAKLDLILGLGTIKHHGASEADQPGGRSGDFLAGDVAVHVTTHPGEALIRKCSENIGQGLRPLIVTSTRGCTVADGLAEQAGIANRIDILDAEQFLAANLHEWGRFTAERRSVATGELIARYNQLIDEFETDPSLKVELL